MTEEKGSLFWHRVKLLGLIGVFLAPFVGGWLALYVFDIKPESKNYGTLVQPVRKLDWPKMISTESEVFEGGFGQKWAFLLFTRESCAKKCQSNLFYMRQIKTLLNRDSDRLQNVLVTSVAIDAAMAEFLKEYPDLVVIEGFRDESLFAQFSTGDDQKTGDDARLYLVDPDQNYMMYYPAANDEHRILEDIRKLMKLSQIG